jgi:L-threonylcarbamoyladenylate synthase
VQDSPSTRDGAAFRDTVRLVADEPAIARAAAALARGGLVAFPTETVYGLGADATSPQAVASLYAAKGRPRFNPLIVHVTDLAQARRHGVFDAAATVLAERFWPGPLTLVVPAAGGAVCDLARAGLASVALRVPAHPIAARLVEAAGRPVVAPSANLSGRISPTQASHVMNDLSGRIDFVLDGGATAIGLESSIVACLEDGPRLLRPGGLARHEIEDALGTSIASGSAGGAQPLAPGALASHYAPRAHVRLDARTVAPGEAALLFGPIRPSGLDGAAAVLNLSETADLHEAAATLFAHLHRLDQSRAAVIAVAPIPEWGLGEAINDRLKRAAAGR